MEHGIVIVLLMNIEVIPCIKLRVLTKKTGSALGAALYQPIGVRDSPGKQNIAELIEFLYGITVINFNPIPKPHACFLLSRQCFIWVYGYMGIWGYGYNMIINPKEEKKINIWLEL